MASQSKLKVRFAVFASILLVASVIVVYSKQGKFSRLDGVITPIVVPDPANEPPKTINLKIYFANTEKDPEISCDKVFPVARSIPLQSDSAVAVIRELLKGPTPEEVAQKYFTSIPEGVVLNSFTLADGVARVDFNDTLDKGVGGSCRVTSIRKQIEETLMEFQMVGKVIISINGRTEDILQP